jgi:hypothetical protein
MNVFEIDQTKGFHYGKHEALDLVPWPGLAWPVDVPEQHREVGCSPVTAFVSVSKS